MEICFVSAEDAPNYLLSHKWECGECERVNLTVFGFNGAGEVCYEQELKGETAYFEGIAKLSRLRQGVVVCGCVTNARGHKRSSAVVAEDGKILGVSDALHAVDGSVSCGAELRIYETGIGKMGIAVAEDIYFPSVFETYSVCGCDFVVCVCGKAENIQKTLLRAYAYCYGIPIYFCANGDSCAVDIDGEMVIPFAAPRKRIDAPMDKHPESGIDKPISPHFSYSI